MIYFNYVTYQNNKALTAKHNQFSNLLKHLGTSFPFILS